MKAKLIKVEKDYFLKVNDTTLATSVVPNLSASIRYSLSLKNCEAIERGYDLDDLVEENFQGLRDCIEDKDIAEFYINLVKTVIMEILGDKKFSEEDMKQSMWDLGDALFNNCQNEIKEGEPQKYIDSIIQSLQQTEWDVEVEMCIEYTEGGYPVRSNTPKLDAYGCLILKRVI